MGTRKVESVDPESSGVVRGAEDPKKPRPDEIAPDDAPDPESGGVIRGSDD